MLELPFVTGLTDRGHRLQLGKITVKCTRAHGSQLKHSWCRAGANQPHAITMCTSRRMVAGKQGVSVALGSIQKLKELHVVLRSTTQERGRKAGMVQQRNAGKTKSWKTFFSQREL